MKNIPITQLMSGEVITVKQHETVVKIENLMSTFLIHHIPVVDDGKLCGIVSRNDLVRKYIDCLENNPNHKVSPDLIAKDIMVTDVISINDTSSIKQAAEIMLGCEFHSIPVVNEKQQVVGIITSSDLLTHLVALY